PTPTPTPTATLKASSNQSARVARANAELIGEASAVAAESTGELVRSMERVIASPSSAEEVLPVVDVSLASARASYQQAECAVFYVDPDSAEELLALPDPLGSGSGGSGADAFGEIATRLEELRDIADAGLSDKNALKALSALQQLISLSGQLETDLGTLAASWEDGDGSNFRGRHFLSSPERAVARIFQGMLAISGDVLPRRWLGGATIDPRQVGGRVRALDVIYSGRADPDGGVSSPGIHDLVEAASPEQDAAVRTVLARAVALSDALALAPESTETRRQLLVALDDLTFQLTLAGKSLGIEIVEVGY
ncbi:MAG: hypothetical protein IAE97_07140, partial [Chthoniobacterales bacterium]|nr:hypothetical protein [Chthoniobacterales bacterium]